MELRKIFSAVSKLIRGFSFPAILIFGASASQASDLEWTSVPISEDALDFSEDMQFNFTTRNGRPVVCLDGKALLRDVRLNEGSIAVDIANEDRRHFANIIFRAQSLSDYETAYLRLHRSGQSDAVQYSPTFNNETNWQFYREAQAAADFGSGDWVTLRVDFVEDRVRVSLLREGQTEATFTSRLVLPSSNTAFGIMSLFNGCFTNLRFSQEKPDIELPEQQDTNSPDWKNISTWSLSQSFEMEAWNGIDQELFPVAGWQPTRAEREGHLLISRYREKTISGRFGRNGLDGVFAGIVIDSDVAQPVDLKIDASDMATIFLNGQAVIAFDNSFRAKGSLFRGDVNSESQIFRLPILAGRNELVVLVAERANGWGIEGAVRSANEIRLVGLE